MELNYSVVPVKDLSSKDYDGIVFVSHSLKEENVPDQLRKVVTEAAELDKHVHETVSVLKTDLPAKRLVYSPTGPLNSDYHDVRSYGEAAKKGVLRALKSGVKCPLVVLVRPSQFPKADLVTLLGVMEGLYVNLQHREMCPEVSPKVKSLGVWSSDHSRLLKVVDLAKTLECGRVVARDVGGADPERMAPAKVEEYVRKVFPASSGVKLEVITNEDTFLKDYPLFAAVNRAASVIDRHKGRILYLTYEGSDVQETLFLVGKGVTYDTGGADIKAGGFMAGMSRDKCGSAAVAGFMKVLSLLKPAHLKVVGVMSMVRNSVGENSYVADEMIKARAGVKVRVGNTDAEGRMIMADVLCHVKEMALKSKNPHLFTIATLTGHASRTVGTGYTISLDNGPARNVKNAQKLQESGDELGDMVEVSTIRREDFETHKGVVEGEDVIQALNLPSTQSNRGHQGPAAFLILTSGLDKHGLDSKEPLRYTHLDIAASSGHLPELATGAPLLALANKFLSL
ncbi:putative aminopeptidase W07G4.4 [Cimex lectularius]|uniref:Cytosol aminopeptidase domain-containing protein n=1 Tax=Cimex lectularius TaxID=79782 RepID=A0A8I6R9P9_CIMLE|nr:putative aminopeptidase W07G4.4 [Cimex lectularius]